MNYGKKQAKRKHKLQGETEKKIWDFSLSNQGYVNQVKEMLINGTIPSSNSNMIQRLILGKTSAA